MMLVCLTFASLRHSTAISVPAAMDLSSSEDLDTDVQVVPRKGQSASARLSKLDSSSSLDHTVDSEDSDIGEE